MALGNPINNSSQVVKTCWLQAFRSEILFYTFFLDRWRNTKVLYFGRPNEVAPGEGRVCTAISQFTNETIVSGLINSCQTQLDSVQIGKAAFKSFSLLGVQSSMWQFT